MRHIDSRFHSARLSAPTWRIARDMALAANQTIDCILWNGLLALCREGSDPRRAACPRDLSGAWRGVGGKPAAGGG